MITGALRSRGFQLFAILTRYQIVAYGRSYYVQGSFLVAVLAGSSMVATGVRSDWLASEVVTWSSLFILLPVILLVSCVSSSVAFVSSEHFIWDHVLTRGISRLSLFVSRSIALVAVGQGFVVCMLLLLALLSPALVDDAGKDVHLLGVVRLYFLMLFLSIFVVGIAGGVSAAGAPPWVCITSSLVAGFIAGYFIYFATGFDFTLINLVDSLGALVRGERSFPYVVIVIMSIISFGFQLAGNWRLTQRDF